MIKNKINKNILIRMKKRNSLFLICSFFLIFFFAGILSGISKEITINVNYFVVKQWEKRVKKTKNPKLYYNLGIVYMNGIGVEKNIEKAIKYFIYSGLPEAMYNLGVIYFNKNDFEKAIKYFVKADKNNIENSFNMIIMSLCGLIIKEKNNQTKYKKSLYYVVNYINKNFKKYPCDIIRKKIKEIIGKYFTIYKNEISIIVVFFVKNIKKCPFCEKSILNIIENYYVMKKNHDFYYLYNNIIPYYKKCENIPEFNFKYNIIKKEKEYLKKYLSELNKFNNPIIPFKIINYFIPQSFNFYLKEKEKLTKIFKPKNIKFDKINKTITIMLNKYITENTLNNKERANDNKKKSLFLLGFNYTINFKYLPLTVKKIFQIQNNKDNKTINLKISNFWINDLNFINAINITFYITLNNFVASNKKNSNKDILIKEYRKLIFFKKNIFENFLNKIVKVKGKYKKIFYGINNFSYIDKKTPFKLKEQRFLYYNGLSLKTPYFLFKTILKYPIPEECRKITNLKTFFFCIYTQAYLSPITININFKTINKIN